jgi:uncharacterized SAM-binding protein YcdF (DUF218 family)
LTSAGCALHFTKRHVDTGRRLVYCGAALFLVFLFSPLAKYLIWNLEKPYPPLFAPPRSPAVDRIAVLSGYAEDNAGTPVTSNTDWQTAGSMSEGLRLYRLAPGAKLIMSGGPSRPGGRPAAAIMADFMREMGVPAPDLIVEGNSRNTYENLREIRKLVGGRPFILVAQGCDLRRAVAVARKLQMHAIPAPACLWASRARASRAWATDFLEDFAHPSIENLSRIQWAYHEYLGLMWYRILGRV